MSHSLSLRLSAVLAASLLATAQASTTQPLAFFEFSKPQEVQSNPGLMKKLLLRLTDKSNQLAVLVGPPGSGVTGESGDSAVHLTDGAFLGFLQDRGGEAILEDARAFTFSAWYKSPALTETSRWPILLKNLSAENQGGISIAVSPDGSPIASFGNESGELKKTELGKGSWLVADDEWRFFAVTFDGEVLRFYRGSLDEEVTLATELAAPFDRVNSPCDVSTGFFGQSGGSDTLNAWIDNLRIFDAELPVSELEELRKGDLQERE